MAIDINLGLSAEATGTVDVITATYSPAPTLVDRKILFLRTSGTNTITTPTFNPNGLGALTIVKQGGVALAVGDLKGDVILMYNSTTTQWELMNPLVKNITVISSTTTTAIHTGTVAETYITGWEVPAGTFTTNDRFYFEYLVRAVGGLGVKTIRVYTNTTNNLAGTPVLIATYSTNNLLYSICKLAFLSATNALRSKLGGTTNSTANYGSDNSGFTTFTIDFTVQQYIVVSFQLANAGDAIYLEAFYLERSRV